LNPSVSRFFNLQAIDSFGAECYKSSSPREIRMPSILVVEQENRDLEQIEGALAAEGYKVRVVGSQAAALQAAASEAPDLVVVSTALPGTEALASSFSRSAGGPGVVALLAEDAMHAGTGGVEAHARPAH